LGARRRGASPIIATILLLSMTVVLVAVAGEFKPPLPPAPSQLYYNLVSDASTPTWGDGSDCKTVNGSQVCASLPAIDIVFTQQSPSFVPISALYFYFMCNGTVYLGAPLAALEWVPGSTASPPANAPQLQRCGTYVPPQAAFNRLVFFEQLSPKASALGDGDTIVVTAHSFEPPNCPNPGANGQCDDDFHGAPAWCYTSAASQCAILVEYVSSSSTVGSSVLRIPLYGMST
jgi:flagellin-like protein